MKTGVKNFILILIGITLVIFDQFTKILAQNKLQGKNPFVIIKGVFEFHYLEGGNTGAAWGILSGQIAFFVIISVIVSIAIVLLIIRLDALIREGLLNPKVYYLFEI